MGTAGCGQVGIRAGLAVVHDESYLVGRNAQRSKRLHGMSQGADIAALSHIFPGIEMGDGAVGIQFEGYLGGVEHADGDDESAHAHADADMPALSSWRLRLRLCTGRIPAWPSRAGWDRYSRDRDGC